ncbi:MAG: flavin reductase family protein [Dysgonomonas sp.]
MKKYLLFITALVFFFSCTKAPKHEGVKADEQDKKTVKAEIYEGFAKDSVSGISNDLFLINHKWMLVTAGNDSSFNTMTASWGGFGTVWERPVAFMTIRDTRYTYEFLNRESVYTISFYSESYKDKMQVIGSKSGRDTDKIKESGLTPLRMPSGAMAFREATMIIECRKLLNQAIDPKDISDKEIATKWYSDPGLHHLFFGEIIGVWKKAE